MNHIEPRIALLEELLGPWRAALGKDYEAYRNHVYRMVHFCFALHPCDEQQQRKVIIAGCFHDLGIWSDHTIDYLPPSARLARDYLQRHGLQDWAPEVGLMIEMHHKLRPYLNLHHPLVEAFRKADMVDVSLGLVKSGLPAAYVRAVKRQFPNAGFHKKLMRLAGNWFSRHPLSAPPFMRW